MSSADVLILLTGISGVAAGLSSGVVGTWTIFGHQIAEAKKDRDDYARLHSATKMELMALEQRAMEAVEEADERGMALPPGMAALKKLLQETEVLGEMDDE